MKYDLRRKKVRRDENPLEMMANLMDVMLVFACGLLLALVVHWNVDISGQDTTNVNQQQSTTTVEMSGSGSESDINTDQNYKEMGIVYQDPETGKLYMVTNEKASDSGSSSSTDSTSDSSSTDTSSDSGSSTDSGSGTN
jgi:hypothetical protein